MFEIKGAKVKNEETIPSIIVYIDRSTNELVYKVESNEKVNVWILDYNKNDKNFDDQAIYFNPDRFASSHGVIPIDIDFKTHLNNAIKECSEKW